MTHMLELPGGSGLPYIGLFRKYSEDEPRDDQGRWTSGGASEIPTDTSGRGLHNQSADTYAGLTSSEWITWAEASHDIQNAAAGELKVGHTSDYGQPLTQKDIDEYKSIAARIQDAAANNAVTGVRLYRGETFDSYAALKEKYPHQKELETPTLVSTSTDLDAAKQYLQEGGPVRAVVEYGTKSGAQRGIQTSPLGVPSNEVILPQGARYRVASVIRDSEGIYRVSLYSTNPVKVSGKTINARPPVTKFDENEPRDDQGRWTDGGGGGSRLSLEQVDVAMLAAGKPFGRDRVFPETESGRAQLLVGILENQKALEEKYPRPTYVPGLAYDSPEYRAYHAADQKASAAFTAAWDLAESVKDPALQQQVAEAWLTGIKADPKSGLGLDSTFINQGYHASVLDYLGKNLPPDYKGRMNLFSTDFDKFKGAFIDEWLYKGGSPAQYAASVAALGLGVNNGKEFWDGNKTRNGMDANFNPKVYSMKETYPGYFEHSDNVATNLQKLYDETQGYYKAKFPGQDLGQKELTLYRGLGSGEHDVTAYKPWAVESWSPQISTAQRFGRMMQSETGRRGNRVKGGYTILTAKVPYSSVIMSFEAQKKYWVAEENLKGKREYTILGGGLRSMTSEKRYG